LANYVAATGMLPSSTFAFGLAIGNGRRYDEEGDQLGREGHDQSIDSSTQERALQLQVIDVKR
jgi:hypothetical protein